MPSSVTLYIMSFSNGRIAFRSNGGTYTMKIKKIRVCGYKSIEDSDYIDCDKQFTILAGKNNVVKLNRWGGNG